MFNTNIIHSIVTISQSKVVSMLTWLFEDILCTARKPVPGFVNGPQKHAIHVTCSGVYLSILKISCNHRFQRKLSNFNYSRRIFLPLSEIILQLIIKRQRLKFAPPQWYNDRIFRLQNFIIPSVFFNSSLQQKDYYMNFASFVPQFFIIYSHARILCFLLPVGDHQPVTGRKDRNS